jgi:hypothetical protein
MKLLIALLVTLLLFCIDSPSFGQTPPTSPDWVKVTDKVAFAARDSSGEVVFHDRMWILGGWLNSESEPPRDVWNSADGITWSQVTNNAPWKHSDLPTSLVFNDQIWMLGGWHNGRRPGASASNQVWRSKDGAAWEQTTDKAGWSPRLGAAGVVFHGKMWILGGIERYYYGTDQDLRNDVWNSADGKEWTQVTAQAPWSPRAYHAALVFDDKIWIFGGGNYVPNYQAQNDVWCSNDGIQWTRVTEHAAWSPRIWFSANVYRNQMWVLGGWSNNPSKNWNDVWHTKDGKHWTPLNTPTIWPPRHEQSTFVFQDQLWLATGNAWPLVGDVWRLSLPADWASQP